jgi:hypothetical protein
MRDPLASRVAAQHLSGTTWFGEISDDVDYLRERVNRLVALRRQDAHDLKREADEIDHAWDRRDLNALVSLDVVSKQEHRMLSQMYDAQQDENFEAMDRIITQMNRAFGRLG